MTDTAVAAEERTRETNGPGPLAGVRVVELGMLLAGPFTGRLLGTTDVADRPAVLPSFTGRAWITGTAQYLLDPEDPFPAGFVL